jgi:hypothetical protein
MNSGIGGMSSFSIRRFIMCVAIAETPGSPPSIVGMCMPGLPTVATLMWSMRSLRMASSPKNVKNRLAAMPSIRAPLAMINALQRALGDDDRDLLDRRGRGGGERLVDDLRHVDRSFVMVVG